MEQAVQVPVTWEAALAEEQEQSQPDPEEESALRAQGRREESQEVDSLLQEKVSQNEVLIRQLL